MRLAIDGLVSCFVLTWPLSVTMKLAFCLEALKRAFHWGQSEIFNID
jgi:hypothetical protein